MNTNDKIICIGSFDGFNKKHQKLILNAKSYANDNHANLEVYIIDDAYETYLCSPSEKDYYLNNLGVSNIFHVNKDFIPRENPTFNENIECQNSVNIRAKLINYLEIGDVENFERLAGHSYTIIGNVVHGNAQGRTVNMPTANLIVDENKILPKNGVYGTTVNINNTSKMALTNINKIVSKNTNLNKSIETYIIDFSSDIYNKEMILDICFYIRDVKKFKSLEEVKKQVDTDLEQNIKKLSKYHINTNSKFKQ